MKQQEEENPEVISGLCLFIAGAWGLAWSSVFWKFGEFGNMTLMSVLFGVSIFLSMGIMLLAVLNFKINRVGQCMISVALMFIFPFVSTCLILEDFIGVVIYRKLETQHLRVFLYLYFLFGVFYLLEVTRIKNILMCILGAVVAGFVVQIRIKGDNFFVSTEVSVFLIGACAWLLFWSYHDYRFRLVTGEQVKQLRMLAHAIAHEMRTPLGSLKSGAECVRTVLPGLLKTFISSSKNHISENQVLLLEDKVERLMDVTAAMLKSAHSGSTVIEMLLMKVRCENRNVDYGIECDAEGMIKNALQDYPFKLDQEEKVHFKVGNNFRFHSNPEAMKYVIFNLLKNALYQIDKHQRGEVSIWLSQNNNYNIIHLKDTAIGIKEEHLLNIFEKSESGTGIGLPFCKLVIDNSGGSIDCVSQFNNFAEFVIKFQKPKP